MAEDAGQIDQLKHAQRIVRLINIICAASVVGLIITFIIMHGQFIFGNGIGLPLVPKLEGVEIMLLILLDFLILLAFLIVAGVLVSIFGGDTNQNAPIPKKNSTELVPQKAG